ncbi:MAG: DUF3109 family protein [Bacteroidales bacterium]|nr:DUF3109 family protein [Bacteroidales bacterium]
MIEIEHTIISLDIIEKNFSCLLSECKGACCIEGDSGAPLDNTEIQYIEKQLPIILKYLPHSIKTYIQENGFYYIDSDGDLVTQLYKNKECVFSYTQNNIAMCAIETAFRNKEIFFNKPLSCRLYPIRITSYKTFTALNLHTWNICIPAFTHGCKSNIRVYEFCKEALCEKFGNDWYQKLLKVVEYIKKKAQ